MRRAALALAVLLAACARAKPGDPPSLVPGRSACAKCGMLVGEARHAGGWVDEKGDSVLFDDAGEFLSALRGAPARAASAWVGDYESGAWLRVSSAIFVSAPGLATPMGSGVVAFAGRARAEEFARTRKGAALIPGAAP